MADVIQFWKCKFIHTDQGNPGMDYIVRGTILSKTVKEKFLGLAKNANMKVSGQVRIAASKGNQVRVMITRNLAYKNLHRALVIPLLEYTFGSHIAGGTYMYVCLKTYGGESII